MFTKLVKLDRRLFHYLFVLSEARELGVLARQLSRTGDGPLYLILVSILMISHAKGEMLFYLALAGFVVELPLYLILKNAIKRTRPCHLELLSFDSGHSALTDKHLMALKRFEPSDKFSLPSGHTAGAFVMATSVAFIYPQWGYLVYLWALLVGGSRIALGVHYPLDILAGAALGSGSVFAILSIGFD